MLEASIILIGDEILSGFVRDSNGHYAADRLHEHGIPLTGVYVIPDEPEVIVTTLRADLARTRPRLVITSGGLGSTPDDATFAAIAHALDVELELQTDYTELLESEIASLREQGFQIDPAQRDDIMSMALVPAGATVLRQSGWVCGAIIDVDRGIDDPAGATIVALPGVPRYFRAVLDELVTPHLIEDRDVGQRSREVEHELPELVVGSLLRRLREHWPQLRAGSYPGTPMVVRIFGPEGVVDEAHDALADWIADVGGGDGESAAER